jgi:membrane-associated phospholipid phosphatase
MMVTEAGNEKISFHPVLRIAAKIISYIFHPLFVPVYVGWFFIYVMRFFPQLTDWDKTKLIISFFVIYTFLPLVTLLLAKALGFVNSIYLKTAKDRILPYVVCQIFYFWGWYVSKNLAYSKELTAFQLAIFLASSLGLIFNSYMKISMHAIAAGVVIALLVLLGLLSANNLGPYISIGLLIAGLVCTSRLINSNHHPIEVYAGLFIGILAQVVAYLFV